MEKSTRKNKTHGIKRFLLLSTGLILLAFGVAFSIKANLGTSPISSFPYVTAAIFDVSVGTTTIIMNFVFVLIQIGILRKDYDPFQLLQFPAAVLFGVVIDVAINLIRPITYSNYVEQWILCLIGIFLVALGVSMEVTAKLVTTAGEGIVLAIAKVTQIKFGNMKIAFDMTLVGISILLSFLFFGKWIGVGEGTVAAAVLVGQITKRLNPWVQKVVPD